MKKKIQKIILTGLSCLSLAAWGSSGKAPADLNMVVSLSSDGHYAIATNTNKQAILWDIKDHSYKIVSKNANVYSAYFIKNTNDFMFQDNSNNVVYVEDTNGNIVKQLTPGFPVYSEIMTSDLSTYVASDVNYQTFWYKDGQKKQLLYYFCSTNFGDKVPPTGAYYTCGGIEGLGKNLTLSVSSDDKTLVGTGVSEIFIWNLYNGAQIAHKIENNQQTVSAISLNGKYVITDDIGSLGYYLDLSNGSGYSFFYSTPNSTPEINSFYQNNDPASAQEYPNARFVANEALTVKFIDQDKFITILASAPNLFNYAPLYDIQDMSASAEFGSKRIIKPIKYLPLIPNAATDTNYQKDWPLTSNQFSRDQAIDTSPSAHILVMSMAEKNGIIVYKYDPSTQTLTREWAGEVSWLDNHF